MNATGQRSGATHRRRGLATVWLILTLPVLLAALCLTVDVGKLWVERAALENAVEAATLAAVRQWAEDGAKLDSRTNVLGAVREAMAFAQANVVDGQGLKLTDGASGNARFEFGCIIDGKFHNGIQPDCRNGWRPAVRLTMTDFPITSACGQKWSYSVSAQSLAIAECDTTDPVRVRLYTPTN